MEQLTCLGHIDPSMFRHNHGIITEGVFLPDGTFRQLTHNNGAGSNQDDS